MFTVDHLIAYHPGNDHEVKLRLLTLDQVKREVWIFIQILRSCAIRITHPSPPEDPLCE